MKRWDTIDVNNSPMRVYLAWRDGGKPHEFHSYDGAGHAFLNFTNAATYRETQAKDAWAKLIPFLKKHLP
jgi:carboxymethylenebutenolidase